MANITDWANGLKLPPLKQGAHKNPSDGLCAMEMVAFIERLPHSDSPPCTCWVVAAYVRSLNDMMTHEERQRLLPYLPRLVGTVSKEHEVERATAAAWCAIKVFAPMAMDAQFPELAKQLREFDKAKGLRAAADAAAKAAAYAAANAAYAASYAATHYAVAVAHATKVAAETAAEAAFYAAAKAANQRKPVIDAALALLDEMLAIGPQGNWSGDIAPAVSQLGACV